MERLFLALTFFTISSCELPNLIQADRYIEPEPIEAELKTEVYKDPEGDIDTSTHN